MKHCIQATFAFLLVAVLAPSAWAQTYTTKPTGGGGGDANTFDVVNVKDYGATGNGVADDSTAIQAAIDAAATGTNPATVYFPRGDYLVNTGLVVGIGKTITLYGDGEQSILMAGVASTNIVTLLGTDTSTLLDGVVVHSLAFDGQNLDSVNGVHATYTDRATVRDCVFYDFGNANDTASSAINFADWNYSTTVENNYVSGGLGDLEANDIEVYSNGGDTVIKGNRTYSANNAGIVSTHNGKAERILIEGNISKNHTRHGILAHYETGATVDYASTLVVNNIISNCEATGIYLRAGDSDGFVIDGNFIEYSTGAGADGGSGDTGSLGGSIAVWGTGRVSIRNNEVYYSGLEPDGEIRTTPASWGSHPIVAIRVVNAAKGSTVHNNTIHYSTGIGVYLYNKVENVSVQGNQISDCYEAAIDLQTTVDAEYVSIKNNVVKVSATIPNMPVEKTPLGIEVSFTTQYTSRVYIEGNHLTGNGADDTYGIYLVYDFEGTIVGNTMDGWDHAVHLNDNFSAERFGRIILFERNILRGSNYGLRFKSFNPDRLYGIGNKFEDNTTADILNTNFQGWREARSVFPYLVFYDTAAPTTGTFAVGDTVINTVPSAGGVEGWICTTGGTPGTWKSYGAIAP